MLDRNYLGYVIIRTVSRFDITWDGRTNKIVRKAKEKYSSLRMRVNVSQIV